LTNFNDSITVPNEVATSTDTLPLQVMVPYARTLERQQKMVPTTIASYNYDSSENKNVNYNNLYNNEPLPLVTPNETYRSIITQHHLNKIQRNIFLPNDAVRDEKVELLHAQMQWIQHHQEETEREKKEDKILQWKEKYREAKQDAQFAQLQNREKSNCMCVIQ